ncbi:hypothetical protein EF405_13465 [Cyclobacteriaceae bacterium YHN15]|nr:hypothetical protein EF405_13465 [Cyclobacteriaceae bacterium YHN15]
MVFRSWLKILIPHKLKRKISLNKITKNQAVLITNQPLKYPIVCELLFWKVYSAKLRSITLFILL